MELYQAENYLKTVYLTQNSPKLEKDHDFKAKIYDMDTFKKEIIAPSNKRSIFGIIAGALGVLGISIALFFASHVNILWSAILVGGAGLSKCLLNSSSLKEAYSCFKDAYPENYDQKFMELQEETAKEYVKGFANSILNFDYVCDKNILDLGLIEKEQEEIDRILNNTRIQKDKIVNFNKDFENKIYHKKVENNHETEDEVEIKTIELK